jgi:hypothetical protein
VRPFLIIGHPGHELRVYRWLEMHQPTVLVMTDGGGAAGEGRVASTESLLLRAGAGKGPLFGSFQDREIYALILAQRVDPISNWVLQLRSAILAAKPQIVVGDMLEGYNPSHDLCRYCINAALELCVREGMTSNSNLSFPLIGRPDAAWEGRLTPLQTIRLDDAALERKCAAALAYAELKGEVEHALRQFGKETFRLECFYETDSGSLLDALPERKPFYETYGERQVAAGKYKDVIRFDAHVRPLIMEMRHGFGLEM